MRKIVQDRTNFCSVRQKFRSSLRSANRPVHGEFGLARREAEASADFADEPLVAWAGSTSLWTGFWRSDPRPILLARPCRPMSIPFLWFDTERCGRHYPLDGNPHTFPGRMLAYCAERGIRTRVSTGT
ncbi:hypothetical protein Ade02nite_23930 [Paractinoplanes deccanensis]|uniref:Uncharacterized protein n=1 Tax=Paractinoplanes deccanensis TaxID=113561 RepID=A0ABQ3Y189_9ACTN|nr:hypothetical protein Ade02nite_23930 [Actinoplanes deccanensis]